MHNIPELKKAALGAVAGAKDAAALERVRVRFLGRKGEVTAVLRSLKDLPLDERRRLGPQAQQLKRELEAAIASRTLHLTPRTSHPIDLSAPGKRLERGHLHPLTQLDREIRRIFVGMNFSVVEGPEVESEYYNFDALNIPPDNPARDAWNTFWIKTRNNADLTQTNAEKSLRQSALSPRKSALLLRTHTSPMQARYMETHEPPFQIIVPGRCFRYEAINAGHEINFHQIEGLMVGKHVTLANFKFVVEEFFKKLFVGQRIEFRFRPSYFPFTEPSVEVDVKFRGQWFELMGAGMVHPRVFEYVHYNPRDWQGFAFGMGLDRLAMIKYQVPDIRLFFSGDLRFVHQF
jgi:phenylalanyl-tRNA synthetase alpha chain